MVDGWFLMRLLIVVDDWGLVVWFLFGVFFCRMAVFLGFGCWRVRKSYCLKEMDNDEMIRVLGLALLGVND